MSPNETYSSCLVRFLAPQVKGWWHMAQVSTQNESMLDGETSLFLRHSFVILMLNGGITQFSRLKWGSEFYGLWENVLGSPLTQVTHWWLWKRAPFLRIFCFHLFAIVILLISLEFYGQNCSNYYTNLHHPQCEGCPLGGVIVPAPMSMVVLGGTTDMEHNTENVLPIVYLCSGFSSPVVLSTGNVKNLSLCSWGFFWRNTITS